MNDASAGAARHTWIRERIAQVPRVRLALTPTPIEEAPNLSRALGGPRIFIKRDDLTGVAFGGNKLRNLEFRLARTMAEQPDTVIVGLDLQSNSARQTIGACNKLGPEDDPGAGRRRSPKSCRAICWSIICSVPRWFSRRRATRSARRSMSMRRRVRAAGGRPHILNDNPMFDVASALAYLETTVEMLEQLERAGVQPTALYMSSSGKGQAGLVLGKRLTNAGHAVHGVTATDEFHVPSRTAAIANETLRCSVSICA